MKTAIDYKLINLDTVGISKPKKVKPGLNDDPEAVTENLTLLQDCFIYYDSLQDFRDRRKKSRKYYRGDQWHEEITDPDDPSSTITEEDYIKNNGKIPFKQNIIRTYVKSILGVYSGNPTRAIVVARARDKAAEADMLSACLEYVNQFNKQDYLNVRNLEEMCVSGGVIGKTRYKFLDNLNRKDIFSENVNPNRFFFNTDISDPRMLDVRICGEIIDAQISEIISEFAKDEEDAERIRDWYRGISKNVESIISALTSDRVDAIDFFLPTENDKCRLYEVWYKKKEWRTYYHDWATGEEGMTKRGLQEISQINMERQIAAINQGIDSRQTPLIEATRKYDHFWVCKYLTPNGQCLKELETPFKHGSHPYAFMFYPFLDGEAWGPVEDMIDQQRYINRLISLIDFIMGAGAKGVVMFPEELKPDDMTWEQVSEEWSKFNGIIRVKTRAGVPLPQQISMNATNVGAYELLNLQLKFIQDISGISNAIQGQAPKSGTPSSLYAQQAQNSLTNVKDFLDAFSFYQEMLANKTLSLVSQFYKEEKFLALAGKKFSEESRSFNPATIEDIDFEAIIVPSNDSPLYRQITDDFLMELLKGQMIDIQLFLENSNLPFADKLLDSINKRQQELQQGQINQAGIAETAALAQQGADPRAMQMIEQYLGK